MKETALEKFLRYVKIDTQSNEDSTTSPSTEKQFNLSKLLLGELKEMGIDATLSEYCYIMATIPSNVPQNDKAYGKVPKVGFIAHVDTSPEVTGENVKPQIINNYQGGDIVLPADNTVVIRESENKKLKDCYGHTLVTTDGTTLLGADNKSGITAIMTAAQTIISNPDIIHGDIKICFTPDEEVGRGTEHFDLEAFGADFAYTIDGDMPGELNKETFSANSALVTIWGRDIHPGMAKDIMINSVRVAGDLIAMLPKDMAPETTEKYQPYLHPYIIEGGVSKTTIKFLLRDFVTDGLDKLKIILEEKIEETKKIYPKVNIDLEIKESYRNMREKLETRPEVLECMWDAAVRTGTNPYWEPIRGGTDGSKLTEKGLPTPNIYTGGQNFHSRTEWLSVDAMNKTVETIINLVQIVVEKSR